MGHRRLVPKSLGLPCYISKRDIPPRRSPLFLPLLLRYALGIRPIGIDIQINIRIRVGVRISIGAIHVHRITLVVLEIGILSFLSLQRVDGYILRPGSLSRSSKQARMCFGEQGAGCVGLIVPERILVVV